MNQHIAKEIEIMNKNKIYNIGNVLSLIAFGLLIKSLSENTDISYCALPLAPLLIAGGGILSSVLGGKKKAAPPPKPVGLFDVNPLTGKTEAQKALEGTLGYYKQAVPGFMALSERLGPRLMNQMFRQSNQFLNKQSELERRAALQAGRNVAEIRALELGTMRGQAPLTRGLMEGLSPEQAAVVQASAQEAQRARLSAQGVTPEEQRMYQQTAREAAQASGRVGGSSAIAAEIMGRENVMAQKRAEAARAEQLAYSQAGEFYTTPGLNLLSNAPLGYKLGTVGAASAMAGGPAASGSFDYNLPLSLGQQGAKMQNQYNQDVYATNLANQQAKAQMWQSIGSSMLGAGMNMAGGGFNFGGAGGGATQTAASPWGNVNYSYA